MKVILTQKHGPAIAVILMAIIFLFVHYVVVPVFDDLVEVDERFDKLRQARSEPEIVELYDLQRAINTALSGRRESRCDGGDIEYAQLIGTRVMLAREITTASGLVRLKRVVNYMHVGINTSPCTRVYKWLVEAESSKHGWRAVASATSADNLVRSTGYRTVHTMNGETAVLTAAGLPWQQVFLCMSDVAKDICVREVWEQQRALRPFVRDALEALLFGASLIPDE